MRSKKENEMDQNKTSLGFFYTSIFQTRSSALYTDTKRMMRVLDRMGPLEFRFAWHDSSELVLGQSIIDIRL